MQQHQCINIDEKDRDRTLMQDAWCALCDPKVFCLLRHVQIPVEFPLYKSATPVKLNEEI